ncbi:MULTISPECIES: hypothetical protein [unclassified Robiginitalea]|uniref:hypothetical protein n=1 Tax=Robiginitalea TaxID=252306 RepID=UPI00234981EE|nr:MULTISPECIES: hypothetical protein [unclassified Robiginitalea]MDC6354149.1 hypothetical protein [Robiginitalea sp. PM2]MDC6374416.1 hypothetical protein [Robiginitalea sp. SP8]
MNALFEGKKRKLLFGLLFDGIGMLSLLIPGLGPALDLIWAPLAGWLMTQLYAGTAGRAAGFVAFAEELLPGTDIVPTFTLMWIYTYWIRKGRHDPSTR